MIGIKTRKYEGQPIIILYNPAAGAPIESLIIGSKKVANRIQLMSLSVKNGGTTDRI